MDESVPKHAHGTIESEASRPSSTQMLMDAVMELYDRIVDKDLLIRRINITANKLADEHTVANDDAYEQADFFTDYEAVKKQREKRGSRSGSGTSHAGSYAQYQEKIWKECNSEGDEPAGGSNGQRPKCTDRRT